MNSNKIIFHHIRNATSKITYNGITFLVDPFLCPKEYYPGFSGAPTLAQKKQRVPMVDLPISMEEILKNLDAVIVTHTHYDHWYEYAEKLILKHVPIFVQSNSDKKLIQRQGFKDVRVVGDNTPFNGITITRIGAMHGFDDNCMGFILKAKGQKTLYETGDTVWHQYVEDALSKFRPDIVIISGAYTRYEGSSESSMMGPDDIVQINKRLKDAIIIPVHMDSYPHCTYTTKTMKKWVKEHKLQERVIVPVDGEIVEL